MLQRHGAVTLAGLALLGSGCAPSPQRDPIPAGSRLGRPAPVTAPTGPEAPELTPAPSRAPETAGAGDAADRASVSGARPEATDHEADHAHPHPATATAREHRSSGDGFEHTGDGDVAPQPSTPDSPAGPIPVTSSLEGDEPPPEVAAAILGAYTSFWDSYWHAASHPVDPEHSGIGRYSTEPLRSRTVGVLRERTRNGVALRLPPDHGAGRILHIEGWDNTAAEVLDCFVDNAVLYEVSTGRVRNDEQATVVHLALLRREGNSWRVSEIFEQAVHTGRTEGCIMQANTHATTEPPNPALDEGGRNTAAHGWGWLS